LVAFNTFPGIAIACEGGSEEKVIIEIRPQPEPGRIPGEPALRTITIRNNNTEEGTIITNQLRGPSPGFGFGAASTCGTRVRAGASCEDYVTAERGAVRGARGEFEFALEFPGPPITRVSAVYKIEVE
jgi:hypothetical protein